MIERVMSSWLKASVAFCNVIPSLKEYDIGRSHIAANPF